MLLVGRVVLGLAEIVFQLMNKFDPPHFKSAGWLPGPHFQTVFASLLMSAPRPTYRREVLDLSTGDIIAADWLDGELEKPLFILVHGMEGNSGSRYARLADAGLPGSGQCRYGSFTWVSGCRSLL